MDYYISTKYRFNNLPYKVSKLNTSNTLAFKANDIDTFTPKSKIESKPVVKQGIIRKIFNVLGELFPLLEPRQTFKLFKEVRLEEGLEKANLKALNSNKQMI